MWSQKKISCRHAAKLDCCLRIAKTKMKIANTIIPILSLCSFVFSLITIRVLFEIVVALLPLFNFLFFPLINDTKWFIEISLRTRYMLVCGQILAWWHVEKERKRKKSYATEGLERLHLLWFSLHSRTRQAKRIHFVVVVVVVEPTGKIWSIHHHSKRNYVQFVGLHFETRRTFGVLFSSTQPVHTNVWVYIIHIHITS